MDNAVGDTGPGRLRFGTAGLRGPVRPGPDGMNSEVVTRTTAALAQWLNDHGHGGATVVVGRDARHGSAQFFSDTVAVFVSAGFDVVALPSPTPTPVLAFTTRRLEAAAGVMITASHNPAGDNGYKVYLDGGAQLIPPADTEIEDLMDLVALPDISSIRNASPTPDPRAADAVEIYLERIRTRLGSGHPPLRIALTAMHGVGGDIAVRALRAAGFDDIHVVAEQFDPDPDFPTVAFPNPEEPGASDLLLALAQRVGADIAIALDPDADRCALGAVIDGRWRMVTGDETGALLGAAALADDGAGDDPLVATTIVSGGMLSAIAADAGARFVETLTGFKWLVRAGDGLRYAYEEAIGHCVDPDAVRDKDGISAAVALAVLAAHRAADGSDVDGALDELSVRHGVHRTAQVAIRADRLSDIEDTMTRLRISPPSSLIGIDIETSDHAKRSDGLRTDAVAMHGSSGGIRVRLIARPSGTEPKLKFYLEVACAPPSPSTLADAKSRMDALLDRLRTEAEALARRQSVTHAAPIISVSGVDVVRGGRFLLRDISLQVSPGEHWALLGPNGAGKSTLLNILGAFGHPTSGTVDVLDKRLGRVDMRELRTHIGHVDPRHRLDLPLSAHDVVLTGLSNTPELDARRTYTASEHERADDLLAVLGMGERRDLLWTTMSQGERGRTLVARALQSRPSLLLLDEPATGLDLAAREQLLLGIDRLRSEVADLASILVTHHLEDLPASTTHALLLRDGVVTGAGPVAQSLTSETISDCFRHRVVVRRAAGRWSATSPGGV